MKNIHLYISTKNLNEIQKDKPKGHSLDLHHQVKDKGRILKVEAEVNLHTGDSQTP